jgi:acyl-CoA hydrolase
MENVNQLYQQKLCLPEEAIKLIHDGDTVVMTIGEPTALLNALSEHRREYHNVRISTFQSQRWHDLYDPETYDNIHCYSYFLGSQIRKAGQEGWAEFIPCDFASIPKLLREGDLPCDVFITIASPMDDEGNFSVGYSTDYSLAAVEMARAVVVEVNPNVPYCYGNNKINISQVTALVEDDTPLWSIDPPVASEIEMTIAKFVAEFVKDGSTIQAGFGPVPNSVTALLTDKQDLGIHTEQLNEGLLALIESGAVTNRKKNLLPGKTICCQCLGSSRVHKYMDHNPNVEMHPAEFVINPYIAGQNDNLVSINGTLQVDFIGHCCSESIGTLPWSGAGGQLDFVRAANISKGGKSFLVMPSTAKNGTISRIVPTLIPGAYVTVSKNDVDHIVTEYGVAKLKGKSTRERTKELIAIAHPDFRAELKEAAKKMNLL